MNAFQVPGASVAVITDFELAYVEVYGVTNTSSQEPVTEKTLFQAASLSKSVSAVAVMTLVQDGVVSLDAEVNGYLTSWQIPFNGYQVTEKVTLKRLLSHTAGTTVPGFRGYRYTESVPTLTQILNGAPPANSPPVVVDFVPGSRFRYSGGGYEVMEQAVRDVTGTSYPDFIRERVLIPAGMDNSTYEQPLPDSLLSLAASGYYADGTAVPQGHHIYPEIGAAGLWTTPTDLARFLIEVQRSVRGDANTVLTRASAQQVLSVVRNDYALGFALTRRKGQPYFEHQGANDGFRSSMVSHPASGHGVVVMTNSDNGLEFAEAVVKLIARREGWPGY